MPTKSKPRPKDALLLPIAALAFATASPLARSAVGLSPITVAAGRTAVAAIAIALVMPRALARAVLALPARTRWALVLAGVLLGAHFALFLGGLDTTSFAAAVSLISLEPLSVVLAAWLLFGIRPRPAEAVGVLVATAGAIVVSRGAGQGEHTLLGDAMVLGAVILFGAYVAAARGLRQAMPPLPYAASVYAVATVTLIPIVIPLTMHAAPPPPTSWLFVLGLGLIPTLVGHTLVQNAARTVSPSLVGLVSPGETLGSLAIGAVLLRTFPTRIEGVGAGLILGGATLAILGARGR